MTASRLLSVLAGSWLLLACGARTTLVPGGSPAEGGGGSGGSVAGGGGVGGGGGGSGLTGGGGGTVVDAGPPPECLSDVDCDDLVGCTRDVCLGGVCQHLPDDQVCNDGLFCSGVEHCDLVLGCIAVPPSCDDGVACTIDSCDWGAQGCVHVPDDSLCPLSHKCSPTEGCYALAYAHSQDTLFEIRLPSGKITQIGPTLVQLTDLALLSNTQLFGLDYGALYDVNTTTGAATWLSAVNATGMVAFDVSPQGVLYAGGGTGLYRLDIAPQMTTQVASYPSGWQASGDLAFLQGRVLATARQSFGGDDALVEFDLTSGTSVVLGSTGFGCVWGLAAFGQTLYGLTCKGQVLRIDPQTGAGTVLAGGGPAFWGASAR